MTRNLLTVTYYLQAAACDLDKHSFVLLLG